MKLLGLYMFFFVNATVSKPQNVVKIKNGRAILNVKVYAKEKEETVILLHGGPGIPDDMNEVMEILKKKFRVIAFDQRGAGYSTCKHCEYTMDNYISDIDAISDYFGLESFHLFGHSWGGLYAQIYASENPQKIKSLFLCSPGSGTNSVWKQTEKEVMQFHKRITSKRDWIKMGWLSFMGMLGSNNAYYKLFKQVIMNYHRNYQIQYQDLSLLKHVNSKAINKTRKEIIKYKSLEKKDNINYPVIITYGDNDIYGESRNDVINRYPEAQVITIRNSGHIPWKHNLNEFKKVLEDFYF